MASSITIDLSNIGDKVAAAIQESMEKMVNEKVAAATKDTKKTDEEHTIAGLREQILANSTLLFPILLKRSWRDTHSTSEIKRSELSVITCGEGTTIRAHVLYKVNGEGTNFVLLDSDDAPDQAGALRKLLGVSSMLLNKIHARTWFRENTTEHEIVAGGRYYHTKEGKIL
ncbi:hypothetical protein AC578_8967 [Pseudocercospora eumusae]|uniref:Uncharacterized protein n=1 Tax=Pseudocercospora eumusae TaxID=321146 RepID=A0A139HN65_9PEZI|nr:hypothetical protein AC578_8967 [Pseudocercospora eumusae]